MIGAIIAHVLGATYQACMAGSQTVASARARRGQCTKGVSKPREPKLRQQAYNLPRVALSNEGVSSSHTVLPRDRRNVERAEISQHVPRPGYCTVKHGKL